MVAGVEVVLRRLVLMDQEAAHQLAALVEMVYKAHLLHQQLVGLALVVRLLPAISLVVAVVVMQHQEVLVEQAVLEAAAQGLRQLAVEAQELHIQAAVAALILVTRAQAAQAAPVS
jgi:hypothetical protein